MQFTNYKFSLALSVDIGHFEAVFALLRFNRTMLSAFYFILYIFKSHKPWHIAQPFKPGYGNDELLSHYSVFLYSLC
jgi:hypothetical protein